MNVGQNTSLCDGDVTQKLVQFLIVSDGERKMARNDTGLLVVAGGVASKLEDFSCQIFENGSEIDGSTWRKAVSEKTQEGKRDKAPKTYQHRHAERSCPSSRDGGHDRRGRRDQPWLSG